MKGLSETQRGYITAAFRQALQNAFDAGYDLAMYHDGRTALPEPDFNQWFDKVYGDIMDEGTEN